jgi:hypothetical protein
MALKIKQNFMIYTILLLLLLELFNKLYDNKGLQIPLNKSYISYFLFIVSIEFAESIHCSLHRIILVCVFHQLCFPFAKFVHCGHYSDLVDESGFSKEIHHVHCFLLVIFQ